MVGAVFGKQISDARSNELSNGNFSAATSPTREDAVRFDLSHLANCSIVSDLASIAKTAQAALALEETAS
jgi:lipopolysaccharide/colanic/teichoic acid biosynthesis glycosyltransferase